MPGSQTELALVTTDFVKIYDLSIDKISPIYYFLIPIGKIKDVTFVYNTNKRQNNNSASDSLSNEKSIQENYIIIMTSCGYLYYETLTDVTSAKNGVYYVTSVIEFNENDFKTPNSTTTTTPNSKDNSEGNQFGGGVSVYYSFKFKLLFWSYLQGKTFMGSLKTDSMVNISKLSIIANYLSLLFYLFKGLR